MKRALKKMIRGWGYEVFNVRKHHAGDGLMTVHAPRFFADGRFREAYARGVQASGGHDPRLEWRTHVALWAAREALKSAGDFVECGVNAGFVSSAILEALRFEEQGRRYFLVDTFAGPVAGQYSEEERAKGRWAVAEQAQQAGAYVTDVERVRRNFAEWRSAVVVQGTVPEVLPSLGVEQVAFVHIDLNCAGPERAALEFFWPRMSAGGVMLFDDYTYFGHEAQGDAIDGFLRDVGAEILALPTGQGLVRR